MRYRDYIPVEKHWFDMFTRNFKEKYWTPEIKVPITKIKIDKSSYPNELCKADVLYMLLNFEKDAWMPITVDKQYFLLDGQHRMELARELGLNYIDVVIQDTDLIE